MIIRSSPPAARRAAGPRSVPLQGRQAERLAIDEFTDTVRKGLSASLVLVGEAGIGKTRLLEYAAGAAADLQVARVVGVEPEARLAYAALHRLLRPYLDRITRLPGPQRDALAAAFGLAAGVTADRFLVGLATLTVLADVARSLPLVCLVDDAHWLDRETADVLAFVARRLHADSVGLLIAAPDEPGPRPALDGLPTLPVAGLPDRAALDLLALAAPGRIAPLVATRMVTETRGNPLALIELTAELSADQLAGGASLPDRLPLSHRMEAHFLRRVRMMPAATRSLLLIASVAPPDDLAVIWRTAALLGLPADAPDPAVAEGILVAPPAFAFQHPLIRSAVYSGAPAADRRRVHAALAEAIDREADPDRRAWHLAEATAGLDEDVAAELERASLRARARGGYATLALFLSRAAELTPDPQRRAGRLLGAAHAHLAAGEPVAAGLRLEQAAPGLRTPTMRAAAQQTRATLAWFGDGVATVVSAMMLEAATDPDLPADLSHGLLFEALTAALLSRQHTAGTTITDVARAARRAPGRGEAPASTTRLLLDAFATRVLDGFGPALPHLRAATAALRTDRELAHGSVPFAMIGNWVAEELLDDEGHEAILRHATWLARERGALHALDAALHGLGASATWAGDFAQADAVYAEAADIATMIGTGDNGAAARQIELLAWRGDEAPARAAAGAAFDDWEARRGFAVVGNHARASLAILELGHGRYQEALAWTLPGFHDDVIGQGNRMLPNLIEAAVRAGDRPSAQAALDRLAERASASGTAWALGVLARSRALLAGDDGADALYREATEHLAGSRMATELARTHLLYGEWLRRRKRRTEARGHLRIAHDAFTDMGAAAFAERTRVELLATGEHARPRAVAAGHDLTSQETRVAALAAAGATNTEIATQLFVTASTVEYHLNKIFRKLDITSRRHLARALRALPQ
ncbi:LuxR C-terminal-related transcriptional regulator [Dactylosporangium sp. AC04546]|uniref:helix-turn-helix transcriptional regulator n=1 Tax=Dactylosporangium sp. AC04546 TaxID=2862460 RepID=UPI001EDEB4F7|nr:LuxR family transcriptional regulator [Dactylosporangium sp. AC04546]WVK78597.1 LuxR C-terminal-related transcriptional regulator [Dactylosporangium sp. AC04546]